MTLFLGLDTTSKYPSISITNENEIKLEYNFSTREELSSSLIPTMEFILNRMGLAIEDIDCIGIAIGPGLFTGIRVGLSTLKGLLLTKPKPIVPVLTLEALAYKCIEPDSIAIPMIDARRNEIYMAAYRSDSNNNSLEVIVPPGIFSLPQTIETIGSLGNISCIGNGAQVHQMSLKKNINNCKIIQRSMFLSTEICRIAYQKFLENHYITDLQQLMPFYIRKPDAEQNLINRQN